MNRGWHEAIVQVEEGEYSGSGGRVEARIMVIVVVDGDYRGYRKWWDIRW